MKRPDFSWALKGEMGHPWKVRESDVPSWVFILSQKATMSALKSVTEKEKRLRWADSNGSVWTPAAVLAHRASVLLSPRHSSPSSSRHDVVAALDDALGLALHQDEGALVPQPDRPLSRQPLGWIADHLLNHPSSHPGWAVSTMKKIIAAANGEWDKADVTRELGRVAGLGNLVAESYSEQMWSLRIRTQWARMEKIIGLNNSEDPPSAAVLPCASAFMEGPLAGHFLRGLLDAWTESVVKQRVASLLRDRLPYHQMDFHAPASQVASRFQALGIEKLLVEWVEAEGYRPARERSGLGLRALGWLAQADRVPRDLLDRMHKKGWPIQEESPELWAHMRALRLSHQLLGPSQSPQSPPSRPRF